VEEGQAGLSLLLPWQTEWQRADAARAAAIQQGTTARGPAPARTCVHGHGEQRLRAALGHAHVHILAESHRCGLMGVGAGAEGGEPGGGGLVVAGPVCVCVCVLCARGTNSGLALYFSWPPCD
jgi:hypothetical protein